MCFVRLISSARAPSAEIGGRLGDRGNGADADVLGPEELQPLGERAPPEDRRELARERLLVAVVLTLREPRPAEQLGQAAEEARRDRGDCEVPAVPGLVDPIAG